LLVGERGKPSLDQIEPTGGRRREMKVKARSLCQPVANQRRFVGSVVVQNQVNIELFQ
jgi:hypothetical protein